MSGSTEGLSIEHAGRGPVLVLVHGTAPPGWGGLVDELSRDHHVVRYARRSFPPSTSGTPASLREHTHDLEALVKELDSPVTLVGWSIGGVIALDFAARNPRSTTALVLVEAALHLKRRPTPAMVAAIITAQWQGRRNPTLGARTFLGWAMRRSDGSDDTARLDTIALDACSAAIVAELSLGTGEEELSRRDLESLTVPTRWLVGTESIRAFGRVARRVARANSVITLENVDRAGHAIHLDRPDAVATAVRRMTTGERLGT